MLVMSNFSFSHSVFKRLVLQTHKNQGLFGKGLISEIPIQSEIISITKIIKVTHLRNRLLLKVFVIEITSFGSNWPQKCSFMEAIYLRNFLIHVKNGLTLKSFMSGVSFFISKMVLHCFVLKLGMVFLVSE